MSSLSSVFRNSALLGAILCLSCGLMTVSPEAAARTRTHHIYKKHRHVKKSRGDLQLRTAQMHLANLGYYKGKVDGRMGPKTKTALRNFQREQHLKVTGKLTPQTYASILAADKDKAMSSLPLPTESTSPPPEASSYTTPPDFYGYYDQQHENAGLLGFPQNVYSRFAKIELSEDMTGPTKRYNITLNTQPLLTIDGQPSIIGISRTYTLGPEDIIILTSYQDHNPDCAYQHHLLVLNENGNNIKNINNCTRGYQAKIANDSLFVTFPEADDGRDVGATWRYEKGDLERL